jgi:hypothetical protein
MGNLSFCIGGIEQIQPGLSGFIFCRRRDQPKRLCISAIQLWNLRQLAQLADYAWRMMK